MSILLSCGNSWSCTCANVGVILLLLLIFILSNIILQIPSLKCYNLMKRIPGPPGLPIIGNALKVALLPIGDILIWLDEDMAKYGSRMKIWMVGAQIIFIKDPKDVQVVLSSMQHITKGHEYKAISTWLQDGLLTSTGVKWQQRRKLLTPTFHFKILENNMATLNRSGRELAEKLLMTKGEPVDVDKFASLSTLNVITETAMGSRVDSKNENTRMYVAGVKRITEMIIKRIMTFWHYNQFIYYCFSLTGISYYLQKRSLSKFSFKIIQERQQLIKSKQFAATQKSGKIQRPFLDLLLEIKEQNPDFTLNDIKEEVDTFMFEGHDTTASAFDFIFFCLASNPKIQEQVWEEQNSIFEGSDRDVTLNDLSRMNYLDRVIKESLRLFPSVPYLARHTDQDLIFDDGVVLPPASNIVIPTYLLHRNKDYWTDPEKFDPDRFLEEEVRTRHPYAYIPFSAGPRNCIGQKFAMMELKTGVSNVIRRLRIEAVSKREDFQVTVLLILRPTKPIILKFFPRF